MFTPYESVLGVDDRSENFFNILRDIATSFMAKLWQNYLPPCTYRSVIPKGNGISPYEYAH